MVEATDFKNRANVIVRLLENHGVTHMFGVAGGRRNGKR
jgi:thiamine pyrophosphate-dependent acetolactate synthase large subunit-like protein